MLAIKPDLVCPGLLNYRDPDFLKKIPVHLQMILILKLADPYPVLHLQFDESTCQAGGVEYRIKISQDITRMFIGSRFKTSFF